MGIDSRKWTKEVIEPGQHGMGRMPCSEVCLQLGVADEVMQFWFLPSGQSVQLLRGGQFFSFPILPGEAGIYRDDDGSHYYYSDRGE